MKSCACKKCREGCRRSPGWFLPGEIEKVANFLNISLDELKNKYLIIDFWCGRGEEVDIWSPMKDPNQVRKELIEKETAMFKILKTPEDHKKIFLNQAIRDVPIPGKRVTWGYAFRHAPCIFLDGNEMCKIHLVKPYECKATFGCKKNKKNIRKYINKQWEKYYKSHEAEKEVKCNFQEKDLELPE